MGFVEAIKTAIFKKYATFSGRASRSEYWWFLLFETAIVVVLYLIKRFLAANYYLAPDLFVYFNILSLIGLIASLILLLPRISVTARRLHDINLSGWWCCIPLISAVISLVPYIFYYLLSLEFLPPNFFSVLGVIKIIFACMAVVLVLVLIKKGTKGPNRFGADPVKENIDATVFS